MLHWDGTNQNDNQDDTGKMIVGERHCKLRKNLKMSAMTLSFLTGCTTTWATIAVDAKSAFICRTCDKSRSTTFSWSEWCDGTPLARNSGPQLKHNLLSRFSYQEQRRVQLLQTTKWSIQSFCSDERYQRQDCVLGSNSNARYNMEYLYFT